MDFVLFTKALVTGFAIAAPVGPIGLICIQQTLDQGAKSGLASGLGAATADAVYGAIGAFGLTAITRVLTAGSEPVTLFGVAFLAWMGVRFLRAEKREASARKLSKKDIFRSFISTFLLTITNPMTIFSFIAVFAALSGTVTLAADSASTMVAGVFLGSVAWWLTLVSGVSLIRHRIGAAQMQWISRAAGILLLGFAGWQLGAVI